MHKIIVSFVIFTLFLSACQDKKQQTDTAKAIESVEASMIKSENPIARLNAASKEMIAAWPEYQKFDELISQYQEISLSDALLKS